MPKQAQAPKQGRAPTKAQLQAQVEELQAQLAQVDASAPEPIDAKQANLALGHLQKAQALARESGLVDEGRTMDKRLTKYAAIWSERIQERGA